jgi:predicted DsbA family dithiol-disulfide isomerase
MTVVIEMVSDIVCPWCWLGLRRIEEARALAPEVEVQLLFRPY